MTESPCLQHDQAPAVSGPLLIEDPYRPPARSVNPLDRSARRIAHRRPTLRARRLSPAGLR